MAGALTGFRVVELSNERSCYAGKLMADMGADVILVEPPGGDVMRTYGPFLDDEPGPERSLYFWHYNTSKRGIVLDLEADESRAQLRRLIASADVVLEAEIPGRLHAVGLDYEDLRAAHPQLVWCSITPFGRDDPKSKEPANDLTILSAGGPVWSCGYDDHSIPPVRGGGNQGYQIGCHFGVMSVLTALLYRDAGGAGQLIDVNMHAGANVTTEVATYGYLAAGQVVQRQTGRHAAHRPTDDTQVLCADGNYANTGVPPRRPAEFAAIGEWLTACGLDDEFPEAAVLALSNEYDHFSQAMIAEDPLVGEIFGAGREAVKLIASKLTAQEYFIGSQERGMAAGAVIAPEDVFSDPHFVDRGFPVQVEHEDLGRTFTYPGAPIKFNGSPWQITRRAPHLGEHTSEVLAELG
ncbi:MAG: CaiB/BaiF CoA transferase family protein [Acidimicrobiales bacterium]